jgi:hypothetical protein
MKFVLILALLSQELGRLNMEHRTLQETSSPGESQHAFWWLNSGGYYFEKKDHSHTLLGQLPEGDKWQVVHAGNNPRDTDNGRRPQNIFRLLSKETYTNFSQEVYFNIAWIDLSESELRAGDNGVLLFSCYQDQANLYYAGIRVDGHPVIKKKVGNTYHTLAYPARVFPGANYHRDTNPNLLPLGTWIGLRSTVRTQRDTDPKRRLRLDPPLPRQRSERPMGTRSRSERRRHDWRHAFYLRTNRHPYGFHGRAVPRTQS